MKKVRLYSRIQGKFPFKWLFVLCGIAIFGLMLLSVPLGLVACLVGLVALWEYYQRFHSKCMLSEGDIVGFVGLPGSGKTLAMAKVARDNQPRSRIIVNDTFDHFVLKDDVIHKSDIGKYDFGKCIICYDEISLDGFDSRDWKNNFNPAQLSYLKRIRQYHSAFMFTSQGWDEADKKIRDDLMNRLYYCEDKGSYCIATCLIKESTLSEIDGTPQWSYRLPTYFEYFRDRSLRIYSLKGITGQLYKTHAPKVLPKKRRLLPKESVKEGEAILADQKQSTEPQEALLTK